MDTILSKKQLSDFIFNKNVLDKISNFKLSNAESITLVNEVMSKGYDILQHGCPFTITTSEEFFTVTSRALRESIDISSNKSIYMLNIEKENSFTYETFILIYHNYYKPDKAPKCVEIYKISKDMIDQVNHFMGGL